MVEESKMLKVEDILVEVERKIPPLPEVIRNLVNLNYYANLPVDKIAEEIAKEPNLAADIMRFVNSNLFLPLRVSSLEHAIVLLGLHSISRIALAFWIKRFEQSKELIGYRQRKRDIALQSFIGAYASKRLADILDPFLSMTAFASASLRLIGKMVLDFYLYSQKDGIIEQLYKGNDFVSAEEKILGMSSPEITYVVCKAWNLPDDIKIPCRYFKNPDRLSEDERPIIVKLTYILHVGDIIAQMTGVGAGMDNMIERFSRKSLKVLKIDEGIIEGLFFETFLRAQKIEEEFLRDLH